MKDKELAKKLDIYRDAFLKKPELLEGAYAEMDAQNYARAKKPANKAGGKILLKSAAILGSVAAVVLVFVGMLNMVISFLNSGGTNPGGQNPGIEEPVKPASYQFADLARSVSSEEEFRGLEGAKYLTEETEGFLSGEYFVFWDKQSGKKLVAAVKYKTIRNGYTEEIMLISDLAGGLKDLSEYKSRTTDTLVRNYDRYINGEYCSDIFLSTGGRAYYVFITSPIRGAGEVYEEIF